MKDELNKMPYKPRTKEQLMVVLQEIWDWVDPRDFRHYIEQLTCKLEDVIEVRGLATIN